MIVNAKSHPQAARSKNLDKRSPVLRSKEGRDSLANHITNHTHAKTLQAVAPTETSWNRLYEQAFKRAENPVL